MAQETKAGELIRFAPVRAGLPRGTIVSDVSMPGFHGANDRGHYGGYLIAESVAPGALPAIVTAVNSHALLVDALREARDCVEDDASIASTPRDVQYYNALLATIDAALAAAGAKA